MLTPVNRQLSTPVNGPLFTLLSVTTLKERLEEAAKDKGVTVPQARADLMRLLGMTRSNMTHWWTGRAKEPKGGAAAVAADYFGVNPLWLAKGLGEKRPAADQEKKKMTKWQGLDEGEIEGLISMYFAMEPDVRGTWRRQGRDLLELMGIASPKNPWGKAKAKKRPTVRGRRKGNA
jgi:transcriptional regulator with XRE-family HTH domain